MRKGSPFEFDIRVSADKKRRARGRRAATGAVEGPDRPCHHPGCTAPGEYRAPRAPDQLDQWLWFCKEHIREYNLKWNFFAGQSDEDFRRFVDSDRVWGRATRPFGQRDETRAWHRLEAVDPLGVLGAKAPPPRPSAAGGTRRLPSTERRALEILDAREHWTRSEIRRQYKSLVKDLHPDLNGGRREDEDRLQEVVWAWDQIRESRNFRD
jgi:hypothetical protein